MEDTPPPPPKKTSAGKVVAFVGCGCLGLIALAAIGGAIIFFSVMGTLKSSAVYGDTLAMIQANPEAIEALGSPIEPGFMLSGDISFNNGVGKADLTVPVSGPEGSGSIHVVADKTGGSSAWTYTTRELVIDGEENRVIQLGP
ncbi:MAG: cytochrome c oxidase assembly factor Coa1 family protein [Verrucomicrobiales bacterium]|nr:cytochrome c oxidase assembly factor Coa1 family protein [Verrucomicrobiales bacterium]